LAYHEISIMDIWEVIRRWHDGQNISQIARALTYDRKTVRCYVRLAHLCDLSPDKPLPPRDEVLRLLEETAQSSPRPSIAQALLMPFLDEIQQLINDPHLGLTAKSAFYVVCQSHDLAGKVSYTSFKRFVRTHALTLHPERMTCRIEVPPGEEVQIDYCHITTMVDPQEDRRRKLYAFIGTLSHSRLKYVELTFSQDQVSFACSHIRMFEFFGGVPKRTVIDNLKSGVIKPDLYDPTLNRTYRDMAEHIGTFIDPARVVHPKDKGKVERDVRTVRDAARMTIVLNPTASLGELNHHMREWSLKEYGLRLHGTTHERPFVVFTEREHPALKPLPATPFNLATWKQATVHPDQYVQFNGKIFNVPFAYCGKKVWIRATEHILQVFYKEKLVMQHTITRAYRHTDYNVFPENMRHVLDTSTTHRSLLSRAEAIGPHFHDMIRRLLEFHAFINLRTAMALTTLAERSDQKLIERAACFMSDNDIKPTPRDLRSILDKLSRAEKETPLPFSEDSREFVRDIAYFINDQGEPS
jgi:transposase